MSAVLTRWQQGCCRFASARRQKLPATYSRAASFIVESLPVPEFDRPRLDLILERFQGSQTQIPPMYSALKRDGQPLYKLARAGIEVERAARDIEIFSLVLLHLAATSVELEVLCSKGTYVRTLAEDLAKALGTCGHVTSLRRVYVEPFQEAAMETLESLAVLVASGGEPAVIASDAPLQHLTPVHLDLKATGQVLHGQAVFADDRGAAGRVRLYDHAGTFIGIGEADGVGGVRPRRLFNNQ
jgi:tRNA pseudouridine55 synthase